MLKDWMRICSCVFYKKNYQARTVTENGQIIQIHTPYVSNHKFANCPKF